MNNNIIIEEGLDIGIRYSPNLNQNPFQKESFPIEQEVLIKLERIVISIRGLQRSVEELNKSLISIFDELYKGKKEEK
jgi:hypothetical protein